MSYIPGDRLWVRLDGYDWWPARVLSDAELASKMDGQTRDPGCDVAVLFYSGTQTGASISQLSSHEHGHNMCFFETSSEKAVTDSDDLRQAIQNAVEDVSANPLKTDKTPAALHTHGSATGAAAAASRAATASSAAAKQSSKRTRAAYSDDDGDGDEGRLHGRGHSGESGYRSLPAATLKSIAQRISAAVTESDVPTLRIVLCDLDNVDVSLAQLEESKIGVAVGNILGNNACKPLWPLARALVSFWARHLDRRTIAAIRRVQEGLHIQTGAGDAIPVPGSPLSPYSPLRLNAFGSPTAASPSGVAGASPTQRSSPLRQDPRPMYFFSMLCRLLDSPENTTPVSTESIERVARDLRNEVTNPDDRSALISRLRNPDLAFVRENLVTGRWTAKQYMEQPEEVFLTEREKEEEKRRMAEKMKAFDSAATAGLNLTEMFKCSNCGSRKCTFHEQQTRGADEPTTKFITCTVCKKAWTEE